MLAENENGQELAQIVRDHISYLVQQVPGTVTTSFEMELLEARDDNREFLFRFRTGGWMINPDGILHGGISATMADQAMGIIANCMRRGEGFCPTINLQVNFHRPLFVNDSVLIRITPVSVTNHLMHMSCHMFRESQPEKLCVSASAAYFCKENKK